MKKLITIKGRKKNNIIDSNIGIVKINNYYNYEDVYGYWELLQTTKNTYDIRKFTPLSNLIYSKKVPHSVV